MPEDSELRDDKEAVGTEPSSDPAAERRQAMAAAANRRDMRSQHKPEGPLPGGPSGDAEAARQSPFSQEDYAGKDAHKEGLSRRQLLAQTVRGALGSRTALARLALGGGIIGIIIAGALFFFTYELVHIRENITHFFDKRMEHSINHRMGAGWVAIIDESRNIKGYRRSTGNPLRDAYSNYNLDKLQADTGLKGEFDSRGKLTAFIDGDGVRHEANAKSLGDSRSFLRQTLARTYPEMGFYRLNVRARKLDAAFGVKRKLLENKRGKLAATEAAVKQKLTEKIDARINGTDVDPSVRAKEDKARQDLQNALNDHEGDAKGTSPKAIASGGAGLVVQGCGLQGIMKGIKGAFFTIREGRSIRWGMALLSAGDQEKRGDFPSSKEVDALVHGLSGFEKSGAYQRLIGNTKAKLTRQHRYSLDGGGAINKISSSLTSNSTLNTVCNGVNSTAGTVVAIGVGAAQAFLAASTGGMSAALIEGGMVAAKSTIKTLAFGEISKVIINLAADTLSKPLLDESSSGEDKINVAIAGYDSYANHNARSNGAWRATAQEVATLDRQIAIEEQQSATDRGLAYVLFSPDYDRSAINQVANKLPASPSTLVATIGSVQAVAVSPSALIKKLLSAFNGRGEAYAEESVNEEEDITGSGVPQHILPDELLDRYSDLGGNEDWIIAYLWANGRQTLYEGQRNPDGSLNGASDSSGELTGKNDGHDDAFHAFVRKCLTSYDRNDYLESSECKARDSEVYNRFRVYRFDLLHGNYHVSNNNNADDQGGGGRGSDSSETTSTAGVAFNKEDLFKSSASVACAAGTKDLGLADGYHNSEKVRIRICAIPNFPSSGEESHDGYGVKGADGNVVVNSRVSGAVRAMIEAANKGGPSLSAISSFRTMSHQQALCPCDRVSVAIPGTSNHQMGLAIDFAGELPSTPGPIAGNAFWNWLSKNAERFGFYNYPREAWHWSPTGD